MIILTRKWQATTGNPKNTAEWWTTTYKKLLLDAESSGVPALQYDPALDAKDPSKQYIVKWTCRGYLLSRVRGAGIKRVIADSTPLRTWMRYSGPDIKATFLAAVPRENLGMELRDFVATVNYEGPLELWGMYGCLFTDSSIRELSTTWLRDNMQSLAKRRKLYKEEHGQNPVPGFLVQQQKGFKTTLQAKRSIPS